MTTFRWRIFNSYNWNVCDVKTSFFRIQLNIQTNRKALSALSKDLVKEKHISERWMLWNSHLIFITEIKFELLVLVSFKVCKSNVGFVFDIFNPYSSVKTKKTGNPSAFTRKWTICRVVNVVTLCMAVIKGYKYATCFSSYWFRIHVCANWCNIGLSLANCIGTAKCWKNQHLTHCFFFFVHITLCKELY